MKKKIKINFVDFWDGFNYKEFYIYQILKDKYNVIISDKPDYLLYSCFSYEHLKYDCIKIYYTGENLIPDFNFCDYAIGFAHIDYEDRYIRYPIYLCFDSYIRAFKEGMNKHINFKNKNRKEFCSMVVSNASGVFRNYFFSILKEYKKVNSGGRFLNNIGEPVLDKREFISKHKFNICFENSEARGYCTEKLPEAFGSGCIPIYWGDPNVEEVFNKKAFINIKNMDSINESIELIKKIDNDDKLYQKYLKEPMLNDMDYLEKEQNKIKNFVYNIFDQDIKFARKVPDSQIGRFYKKNYKFTKGFMFKRKILIFLYIIKLRKNDPRK